MTEHNDGNNIPENFSDTPSNKFSISEGLKQIMNDQYAGNDNHIPKNLFDTPPPDEPTFLDHSLTQFGLSIATSGALGYMDNKNPELNVKEKFNEQISQIGRNVTPSSPPANGISFSPFGSASTPNLKDINFNSIPDLTGTGGIKSTIVSGNVTVTTRGSLTVNSRSGIRGSMIDIGVLFRK